jgi:hypothetical protein
MKRLIPAALAFALSDCATPTLTPLPSIGQTVDYHSGQPTIISRKRNIVIAGLVANEVEDYAIFYIGARNQSGSAATLGTENISAATRDHELKVLSYENLLRHEKVSAVWSRIGLAMNAGIRSTAAAQPSRTYVQGSIYGNDGSGGNFSAAGQTYDPAAAAVAQSAINADTRAQASELNAETAARMGQLSTILRTTTIYPGQFAGGVVEIDNHRIRDSVNLRVNFAGEAHEFAFRMNR